MKILSVVGARPQFVKLAPVASELSRAGQKHVIVHTGQHYDKNMSDDFFEQLGIPRPDVNLEIGSSSQGRQTGAMLAALDEVLETHQPDQVLVYGDTNSTLAGAIAAVKMHIPLVHLEAGLRSFNRAMPEEHNRVATDHLADLCLAPTDVAVGHLRREGLEDRTQLVGDVMTDVLFGVRDLVQQGDEPGANLPIAGRYRVATLHRAENTDDKERLESIVRGLAALETPTVLLVHPRLRQRAKDHGITLDQGSIVLSDPLSYQALVAAVLGADGVITDSGGLQKEAFLLRVPCTTVRPETEWVETVDLGWNVICPDPAGLQHAVERPAPPETDEAPYGDGQAAKRVVDAVLSRAG